MKRYNYILLSVLFGATAIMTSCQRDEEVIVSTITTNEPAHIQARSASLKFQISYNGTITNCGVCYSQSEEPTIKDAVIEYGDSLPEVCLLTDLEPETRYYVRSFVQNGTDILYGNEVVFTTTAPLMSSGHEYVDLGLSVMWATCNVGAEYPEDYGYHFAWGEIEPKKEYTWENYKYGSSITSILKYSESAANGVVDNKVILDLWDDAAYMNWGGNWRMPTYEELLELVVNTTWTWTTQNGVRGCRVRSKINGNSIFFPATGYYRGTDYLSEGINVGIWSSSLWFNGAQWGTGMAINSTDTTTNEPQFWGFLRFNGDPVRPVLGEAIDAPTLETPTVITEQVPREIGPDFINVRYKIISDNGSMPTEMGVCYSTAPNPTINGTKKSYRGSLGSYWAGLVNLQEGTTYYIRAYAINEYGVAYGEEIAITTSTRLYENGYEYVDLGLSVKWATMNVGATSPEGYGDYFAWGETEPKTEYSWANYSLCEGTETTMTKYCTNSQYGNVDNKTTLDMTDDAAHVNMGGNWRMPTDAEISELGSNTTWYWTQLGNGVSGYTLVSKINQHSIFLPAAGYMTTTKDGVNTYGYYWTCSIRSNNVSNSARTMSFEEGQGGSNALIYRFCGQSVRGVVGQEIPKTQTMFEGTPESRGFYTPSEVYSAYGKDIDKGDSIKVGGVISRWSQKSSRFNTYRSVSYFISDGVNEFEYYNSYSINKDSFAIYEYTNDYNAICIDENGREFHIGDTVVGTGVFAIYNGMYEFNTNCYLIDWRPKAQ